MLTGDGRRIELKNLIADVVDLSDRFKIQISRDVVSVLGATTDLTNIAERVANLRKLEYVLRGSKTQFDAAEALIKSQLRKFLTMEEADAVRIIHFGMSQF